MLKCSWDKLKIFYMVASHGSISAAAQKLNISQSALSRHVINLEHQLKCSLFKRLPQGVILTFEGERWFRMVEEMQSIITKTVHTKITEENMVGGLLRVSAPRGFIDTFLSPYLSRFLKDYPDFHLYLLAKDQEIDPYNREVDLAILPFKKERKGFTQTHFIKGEMGLFASQEHLNKFGVPKNIKDLNNHKLAYYSYGYLENENYFWPKSLYESLNKNPDILITSSSHALLDIAKEGVAIIPFMEQWPIIKQYDLIRVLPGLKSDPIDYFIVVPSSLQGIKRITFFIDYLRETISRE